MSRRRKIIEALTSSAWREYLLSKLAAWNRNQVSAIQVARATGALMLVAAQAELTVYEYGPNEVKQAITGLGNADKRQVRAALVRIHGLRDVPSQPDAADAVAVALTHLTAARMRELGARALAR